MKKRKVYIQGPITGVSNLNRAAFAETEAYLRSIGFEPVNPHNITPGDTDLEWVDYMRADIKVLMDCDEIYSMEGSTKSKGATLEAHIAHQLDIPVYTREDYDSLVSSCAPISVYKINSLPSSMDSWGKFADIVFDLNFVRIAGSPYESYYVNGIRYHVVYEVYEDFAKLKMNELTGRQR